MHVKGGEMSPKVEDTVSIDKKIAEDHHPIRQGTQPRLFQHHQFLR